MCDVTAFHPLLLHPPQDPAKPLVLLNLAQILHTVPTRYVQQHQGYYRLRIRPAPLLYLKIL
jgi:hypothetical protein